MGVGTVNTASQANVELELCQAVIKHGRAFVRHAFFSLFKDVIYPPDFMKCYLERFTVQISLFPKPPLIHSA